MPDLRGRRRPVELAIVLHTHMPYVEGFGTWPFGEEWLWEAIATSYVPLLEVLGRAPLTLSLTPVLCDQLEQPDAIARCLTFLQELRPESHRLDGAELDAAGHRELSGELARSAADYAAAARALERIGSSGGLVAALGAHASWTSTATHAVLPLLATDSGVELQVQTGIASHRRRFGAWHGGFWLPECGYAPWLDPLLEEAGVRCTCVELTGCFGLGDERHLRPLITAEGPVLWPIDREIIALAWDAAGYPSGCAYRDHYHHTTLQHRVWRNDGAPYDRADAARQVRADARDFVSRVIERVRDGGVCVFAVDTELLGHWWFEGVQWLGAVLDESARQGLALTTLDDAIDRHEPAPAPDDLPVSSWGEGGDLRTWSGAPVADMAWEARTAELALAAAPRPTPERALRELLALQSSDWAFLAYRRWSGDSARRRARGHREAMAGALGGAAGEALGGDPGAIAPALRGLAPELVGWT